MIVCCPTIANNVIAANAINSLISFPDPPEPEDEDEEPEEKINYFTARFFLFQNNKQEQMIENRASSE